MSEVITTLQRTLTLEQEYAEMEQRIQALKQATAKRREKIASLKKTPGLDAATRTQLEAMETNELKSDAEIEDLQRQQDIKKAEIEAVKQSMHVVANELSIAHKVFIANTPMIAGTTLQTVTEILLSLKANLDQAIKDKHIQDQGITLSSMLVQGLIANIKELGERTAGTAKLTHNAAVTCNTVKEAIQTLTKVITTNATATYSTATAALQKACSECNTLFTNGSPFQPFPPKPLARELRFVMTTDGATISDGCGTVTPVQQKEDAKANTTSHYKGTYSSAKK